MSECNIYKLIEEFINSNPATVSTTTVIASNDVAVATVDDDDNNNNLKLLTPPQSPQLQTQLDENEEDNQKQIVIEEIKSNEETVNSANIRPNRPYSYYVATNFHPFDQTTTTTPVLPASENKLSNNLTIDINNSTPVSSVKKRANRKKNKNRLSVSLTDIKKPNSKMTESEQENLKPFASQNCILNENQNTLKLKQQFEANGGKTAKVNRLNKLIRRLFTFNRKIKSSSPMSSSTTTPMTMLNNAQNSNDTEDINHIQHINYNTIAADGEESRFVRFFTSFRSTHAYNQRANKSSNCTPVVSKKEITPPQSNNIANTSNNLPHLSLLQVNTSYGTNKSNSAPSSPLLSNDVFYAQVVNKLKRIADDCLNDVSVAKSTPPATTTVDNESIPFIDDEDTTSTTVTTTTANTSFSFETFNSNELTFSRNKLSSSTKYDLTDDLVKKLITEIDSYSAFNSIVNQVALQDNIDWNQIAIVFELISRAVKQAGSNFELKSKIKKNAVEYIDKRYRDWILKQEGGWMSVPDSKTGSYRFIGDLHNFNY